MSERDRLDAAHYRSLFEGSQSSLADMAARQAQALGRVGRLRSAIVAVLRKNFMELSAQAEANLGGRLSEVDDEILLAYLDAFTAAASRGDQRATVQALKEAVTSLGIPLRGDEPLVWVEQIHQHRQRLQQNADRHRVADKAAPDVAANPPAAAVDTPPARPAGAEQPLPVDDYWKWDDVTPLGELFEDAPETEQPKRWENQLGTPVTGEDRWTPSPIVPALVPRSGPSPTPAVAPEPEETVSTPAAAKPGSPATTWSGAWGSAAATPATTAKPAADGAATADVSAPLRGAEIPDDTAKPATGPAVGKTKRQPRKRATAPVEQPVGDVDAAPQTGELAIAETPAASTSHGRPPLVAPGEDPADLADLFDPVPVDGPGETPAAADGGLVESPLRPELFAPSAPKRRRNARNKAKPPLEVIPLTEGAVPLELNDGMRRALLAAASIPRPVFTRDLIGVAGSPAMVDAWEAECRADVPSSPVRFVSPKSRHRLRGHLVAVEPAAVRPGDWWYQAVQRYRAGRLYELAVLLHRVGDEIVSFTLEDHVAVFRLNTPRGLVGMVVLLDPRPVAGGETSSGLAGHLEALLSERLTMIAVLTASAEPGSLENLIAHVEELAAQRSWQPTAPVIAARSWEYADDRGTSAVMVLGQS